jgi:hypothetical protein
MEIEMLKKLMLKLGYVPIGDLEECQKHGRSMGGALRNQAKNLRKQIDELELIKEHAISGAIRDAKMFTFEIDDGYQVVSRHYLGEIPTSSESPRMREPSTPRIFRISTDFDMSIVERVRDDVYPRELDYFIEQMVREIRNNLRALMRLHF